MAVSFSDGWESGDTSSWTNTVGTAAAQSTVTRTGTYALSLDGGSEFANRVHKGSIANASFYRIDFYAQIGLISTTADIVFLEYGNTASDEIVQLKLQSNGKFRLRVVDDAAAATIAIGSTLNTALTGWHKFTLKMTKSTGNNGEFLFYIDDGLECSIGSIDNDTLWGAGNTRIIMANASDTAGQVFYVDDLYVQDADSNPYLEATEPGNPTLVGSNTTDGATSCAVTAASGSTGGSGVSLFVVAALETGATSPSVADTQTNTYTLETGFPVQNASDVDLYLWRCHDHTALANGNTVTVSWTGTKAAAVAVLQGTNIEDAARDAIASTTGSGNTVTTGTSGSTSQADALVLGLAAFKSATTPSAVAGSGYTEVADVSVAGGAAEDVPGNPTVVGTNDLSGGASTSVVVTTGAEITGGAGNSLFVFLSIDTGSTGQGVTDTQGNTYTLETGFPITQTNQCELYLWRCHGFTTLANGNTITAAWTGSKKAVIGVLKGTNIAAEARDVIASATGTNNTLTAGTTGTTTQANAIVLGAWSTRNSASATPAGAQGTGFTESVDRATTSAANRWGLYVEYKVVAATGTQAATATGTNVTNFAGATVVYKSTSSGASDGFGVYAQYKVVSATGTQSAPATGTNVSEWASAVVAYKSDQTPISEASIYLDDIAVLDTVTNLLGNHTRSRCLWARGMSRRKRRRR